MFLYWGRDGTRMNSVPYILSLLLIKFYYVYDRFERRQEGGLFLYR